MATSTAPALLRELSHELRDALSPVRSALDLMRLRGFSPETSSALAMRIEQGLDRALTTLDAFVLAEQCESGALTLAVVPVALSRLLELGLEALPAALRARCRSEKVPKDVEVLADPGRSVQVLSAMLQRVLAAVPEKTPVELRSQVMDARVEVRVGFSGASSPSGETWFETYRSPPGAAPMPLRTARALMKLQQGGLELREGEGGCAELVASFRRAATVPVGKAGARGTAAGSGVTSPGETRHGSSSTFPTSAGGGRLLMVEDNADVRRAYREALLTMGYQVSEARTGEEALAAAAASPPEIVLIDINLPGMNGYRLAQALKTRAGGPMRLVMLSGVTLDEITQQLSRQAGFDQCFDKAAGPKALHELLMRLQGGGPRPAAE